jgi:ribosomal protein L11 methyltransferase
VKADASVAAVRFSVSADPDLLDALADCLLSAGAGALEEMPGGLTAYADTPELERALREAVLDFRARVEEAELGLTVEEPEVTVIDADWNQAWLQHLEPEHVTSTFVARPTSRADVPKGERTIWLEPSPAFGEGGHASTRLAAEVIEREAERAPGRSLLDVGTGTGLLALVGLASGFENATGIDIDEAAVEAAKKNAHLNGVADRFTVSGAPLDQVSGRFDVVVANMIVPTLIELAEALRSKVAPTGSLVLSGLLQEDSANLARIFEALGLTARARKTSGDWCVLEFTVVSG